MNSNVDSHIKSVETKQQLCILSATHFNCKVYRQSKLLFEGTITECCTKVGNRNWQSFLSRKVKTLSEGESSFIEHHGYSFVITKLTKQEPLQRDARLYKSFATAKQLAEEANKTLLFSFDEWKGFLDRSTGKSQNRYYKVRCNDCGTEYLAYFKTHKPYGKGVMQCPTCAIGHRNKDMSYSSAIAEATQLGLIPMFSKEEWKGRANKYPVKCKVCGMEFTSSFEYQHFNKCPYCSESHSEYNQIAKLQKICEENECTLLSDVYVPGTEDGHPRYDVKCNICGTEFKSWFIGHNMVNCPKCCVRMQRSNRERLISKMLDDLGIEHYNNYRGHGITPPYSSNPLELDVFIPSLNIAFEFNGQAWHNCGEGPYRKDRNYHKMKTELFLAKGIKVYHIWDFVSDELCKSIVRAKCGVTNRIFARKLKFTVITKQQGTEFFKKYHVDGDVRSNAYFALTDNDNNIMCCMSLLNRVIQSRKITTWEIGRFATIFNTTVIGGYSKLLKHAIPFLKDQGVTHLVSYCNRDLSPDFQQTFYFKQGFKLERESGPVYWYWASRSVMYRGKQLIRGEKYSRQTFQKQLLLEHFSKEGIEIPTLCTEQTLCAALGLYPVFNSGNWKFYKEL